MLQVHTCVSVHCGQCGASPAGLGFQAHHPTETAALDAASAAGWVVGPGGVLGMRAGAGVRGRRSPVQSLAPGRDRAGVAWRQ
jgi:hypothetical protein